LYTKQSKSLIISMTEECGVAGANSRITGGSESAPHKYPWMASIFMRKGADTFFCGGTLVIC
jgi:hypothetical protein